jgi:hypothetical protein
MTETIFTSPEHRHRFGEAIQRLGKIDSQGIDLEYGAALYVLTASSGTWDRAKSYVASGGIDFEGMLGPHWSEGYVVLIQWAAGLFNGSMKIDPSDLMRLDEKNFELALAALKIRRYGLRLDAVSQAKK